MAPLSISAHNATRFSEIGFLLFAIAGVWLVIAALQPNKWERFRHVVAGALIAVGAVLEIVVQHWGMKG